MTAADALDSLHAFELVAALWCHAVEQRLAGPAVYLLPDELEEQAKESLANSRRLAKRIAQLGGAPRCHPAELLSVAKLDGFAMPDSFSDPAAIVGCALAYQRHSIAACSELLHLVDGKDVVTARLVERILAGKVEREDEMEASLGSDQISS